MQPRNGDILVVIIGLQEPQHFDVALIDFVRTNRSWNDRLIAAAMSARRRLHASDIDDGAKAHQTASVAWATVVHQG